MSGQPWTEMAGHAIPMIPSNLEAMKEMPSSLVICPKEEFLAVRPARVVVS
jgi:hypothetical protein